MSFLRKVLSSKSTDASNEWNSTLGEYIYDDSQEPIKDCKAAHGYGGYDGIPNMAVTRGVRSKR